MNDYMDVTVAISQDNSPLYGDRWAASVVDSFALESRDDNALLNVTGYGATPLEAVANLFLMATKKAEVPT